MFIEWPIEHQKNMQEHPFRIGIYGENKFKPYSRSIQIKTIKGKPIELINITQVADVKELDILFLSEFKKKDLPEILNHAKESKILTIAEQYGAGKKGVMINFYIENNTVRFELNKTVLDENNFKVSSKLWRMAKIIQ
ncbi:MAG: YfiR family protein [Cytophagales bacterium]|nr:YfiR family protein [Cytophagales bacterium]